MQFLFLDVVGNFEMYMRTFFLIKMFVVLLLLLQLSCYFCHSAL